MRKLTVLSVCIVLVFGLSFSSSVMAADEDATPQRISFTYFQVKPGMQYEFEELVKNTIPLLKEMGVTEMDILKTSNFGMKDKYLAISPFMEPAALDANLSKESSNMIPVSIASLMSGISQTVDSAQDFMIITMPDFDFPPADDYEPKLIHSVTIGTEPGHTEAFERGIKEVMKAIGKTNVKGVVIGQVGIGGNLDEYIILSFNDSFEEMVNNEPAIQKEFSAADLTSLTGVVTYRKSEVFVRIPELCFEASAD